ncbi:hypothetical protein, partial [Streptococcus pneumoniae]|uniref:hypothetical protein n=1 Tax=Streptococcus pneumoniae TaxID=1313 RepID=UPI0018B0CBBF
GQYDKAIDAYNVLVKNPDTQAEAFAGMAQVAHEKGDYKASKDFQEKARSLGAYNNADLPMFGGNDKIQAGNDQTYLGDNPEQQVPVGSDTR